MKDVDVSYHQIMVRDGKGAQDHVTMLPDRLKEALQAHVRTIQQLHQRDLEDGFGRVYVHPCDGPGRLGLPRRIGLRHHADEGGSGEGWLVGAPCPGNMARRDLLQGPAGVPLGNL